LREKESVSTLHTIRARKKSFDKPGGGKKGGKPTQSSPLKEKKEDETGKATSPKEKGGEKRNKVFSLPLSFH